jgi:meso-butanediol dehydrogenase/(S,S)-butanediol dehydrogenase/diacetyl reductase
MRLAGKVAVVTGGGSGIGRGIVLALAREGADIAIPDIQVLNAEKVAGEVKGLGRKVVAMKTDVTSAADVKTMIDRTRESFGKIDILVNKAGRVVNIASIAGPISAPTMPPYSVAKMGVITLTRIIAKELAPHGVTVNAICPGVLWTDFWQKLAAHLAETNPVFKGMTARQVFDKRVADITPMKREQTPEDIGWAAVFLASDEARNITGQALNVDGGVVMQ